MLTATRQSGETWRQALERIAGPAQAEAALKSFDEHVEAGLTERMAVTSVISEFDLWSEDDD